MKVPVSIGTSLLVALTVLPATQPVAASPDLTNVAVCRAALRTASGTVVDAATLQPLSGAVVMVPVANGLVLTDSQGRFNFGIEGQADRVAIRVQFPGYVTSTRNIALGEQDASIQLQKLGGSARLASNARAADISGASASPAWKQANGAGAVTGGYVARDPTPFATADLCAELF